jgi:hypothetical protein
MSRESFDEQKGRKTRQDVSRSAERKKKLGGRKEKHDSFRDSPLFYMDGDCRNSQQLLDPLKKVARLDCIS